jgi:hypothetical protein
VFDPKPIALTEIPARAETHKKGMVIHQSGRDSDILGEGRRPSCCNLLRASSQNSCIESGRSEYPTLPQPNQQTIHIYVEREREIKGDGKRERERDRY